MLIYFHSFLSVVWSMNFSSGSIYNNALGVYKSFVQAMKWGKKWNKSSYLQFYFSTANHQIFSLKSYHLGNYMPNTKQRKPESNNNSLSTFPVLPWKMYFCMQNFSRSSLKWHKCTFLTFLWEYACTDFSICHFCFTWSHDIYISTIQMAKYLLFKHNIGFCNFLKGWANLNRYVFELSICNETQ